MGDFNVHVDCSGEDSDKFIGLLDRYGLKQHVAEMTHARGHTLDLIITLESGGLERGIHFQWVRNEIQLNV